jgi:hypothetical protein
MNNIDTNLFGNVSSPDDFGEILKITAMHSDGRRNVYMWRGQGNIDWPMHSSAYRRLMKKYSSKVSEDHMRHYEKDLLNSAAHQGYDHDNGRKLSDLEVLAKLQHHGAATRLVDFSRNILVSLWFACNSEPKKTGLLLGIHTDYLGGYEGELGDGEYDLVLGDDSIRNFDHPQSWQPPVVTKRIAAQGAQFLYSAVSSDPMGSLAFDKHNEAFISLALSPKFKKYMLLLLEGTFDIRHLTLFPDIDGFCFTNSERFRPSSNHRW